MKKPKLSEYYSKLREERHKRIEETHGTVIRELALIGKTLGEISKEISLGPIPLRNYYDLQCQFITENTYDFPKLDIRIVDDMIDIQKMVMTDTEYSRLCRYL